MMTINTALDFHQRGQLDDARRAYESILSVDPGNAQALHFSGVLAYQNKQYDDAERLISQSIQIDASQPHYYCNYGMVLRDHGKYAQAVDALNKAIALKPDYDEAYLNLSAAYFNLDKFAESAQAARKTIELNPTSVKAYDNLGTALRSLNDFPGSVQSYRRAIELDPGYVAAYSNLAATYFELKDLDAIIILCNQAIRLDPNHAYAYLYLGIAYQHQNDFAQAEKLMRHAEMLAPDNFMIKWNLGLVKLAMGDLPGGWAGYESRWYLETSPFAVQPFDYPWWQGESMPDKTLLVWWEQGVADQIMFASMFEDLIARFKLCIIAVPKKLLPLFARSFPAAQFIGNDDAGKLAALGSSVDVQSAIGSLARWLRPDIASFPKKHHYLVADPARVAYWKQRLDALGPEPKVGICWRSGNMTGGRIFYCSRIEQWGPILSLPGAQFVNLQYDECSEELSRTPQLFGTSVHAFAEVDLFDDLDETAALTTALDLVVAVPTNAAILAAALGTPAWMLFSGYSWQSFGTDENRWYATARSFGRAWSQPWEDFMPTVAQQLKQELQKLPR